MYVREAALSDFVGVAVVPFLSIRSGRRIYGVSKRRSITLHKHVLALRIPVLIKLEAWQMPIAAHAVF